MNQNQNQQLYGEHSQSQFGNKLFNTDEMYRQSSSFAYSPNSFLMNYPVLQSAYGNLKQEANMASPASPDSHSIHSPSYINTSANQASPTLNNQSHIGDNHLLQVNNKYPITNMANTQNAMGYQFSMPPLNMNLPMSSLYTSGYLSSAQNIPMHTSFITPPQSAQSSLNLNDSPNDGKLKISKNKKHFNFNKTFFI